MSPEFLTLSMFIVLAIFLLTGHPLAFALGGVGVIFGYFGLGPQFFVTFMSRIYNSTMENFVLVAVTLFVFMGNILTLSGVADRLFMSLRYLFGPIRGGLGLAVIAVCIVFAACTGLASASVASIGLVAGPLLLRYGYQRELVTGMLGAGGCLGVLIPPSVLMVIIGDQANLSVGKLLFGTAIPGVILGIFYMIYVAARCWINPSLGPALPKDELAKVPVKERIKDSTKYALPPMMLIGAVLGSIFIGVATPTEAAGVGSFAAFILTVAYGKFRWHSFRDCIYQTAKMTTMIFIVMIGASFFTAVFLGLGGGTTLVEAIMRLGLGKWGTYVLMLGIQLFLGCFIDQIAIIMITFPIFIPLAQQLGLDPIWFAIMMGIVLQMGYLTPPFGYVLFFLSGLKLEGVTLQHIYRGVYPFILIQLGAMVIFTYWPQLSLWLPSIMIGK